MLMRPETKRKISASQLFFFAIFFLILGIAISSWQVSQISKRNTIKQNGQKTSGYAISRTQIQYQTPKGIQISEPLAGPMQGTLKVYDVFDVYYDKEDVSKVVIDQDDTALNVTIWIIAIKMYVGAFAFGFFGFKKIRVNS